MIDLAVLRQIINDNGLIIQVKNDNYDETECLMNIADDLELLLKPKNNGWISVDDGLPEPIDTNIEFRNQQNKVQIYYRDIYGNLFVDYAWYVLCYDDCETYAKWELCNDKEFIEVLCWQYLPEPPKE